LFLTSFASARPDLSGLAFAHIVKNKKPARKPLKSAGETGGSAVKKINFFKKSRALLWWIHVPPTDSRGPKKRFVILSPENSGQRIPACGRQALYLPTWVDLPRRRDSSLRSEQHSCFFKDY